MEVYFYESVIKKIDYFYEIEAHLKNGTEVVLYIGRNVVLNKEELIKVCEQYGKMGCKISVDIENYESVFNEEETSVLRENFAVANNILQEPLTFKEGFTLNQAETASRRVDEWVAEINSATVNGQPLSPFEKFIYAFEIVSLFKYNAESAGENEAISRALPYVLTGDKIVCVGFADLLGVILNRCGIKAVEDGFYYKKRDIGHQTCAVWIKDDKYNMNSIFRCDPTFGAFSEFGSTLAGVWRGYNTIREKFTEQVADRDSLFSAAMKIPKPIVFENITGTNAKDTIINPPRDKKGNPIDVRDNFVERIIISINPAIEELFNSLDTSRMVPRNPTEEDLVRLRKEIIGTIANYYYFIADNQQRSFIELHQARSLSAEELQKRMNELLEKSKDKLVYNLKRVVYNCMLYNMSLTDAKNFIFETLRQEYKLTYDEKSLLKEEERASQYYLFSEKLIKESPELNVYDLLLAARNVELSKGCDIVLASQKAANLVARSVLREAGDIDRHRLVGTREVFSQLLNYKIIEKQLLKEYAQEEKYNADLLKKGAIDENLQHEKRDVIIEQITGYLYDRLIGYAFNESFKNPELIGFYAPLFEAYPAINLVQTNSEGNSNPTDSDNKDF